MKAIEMLHNLEGKASGSTTLRGSFSIPARLNAISNVSRSRV
jgi:hypothetical protein